MHATVRRNLSIPNANQGWSRVCKDEFSVFLNLRSILRNRLTVRVVKGHTVLTKKRHWPSLYLQSYMSFSGSDTISSDRLDRIEMSVGHQFTALSEEMRKRKRVSFHNSFRHGLTSSDISLIGSSTLTDWMIWHGKGAGEKEKGIWIIKSSESMLKKYTHNGTIWEIKWQKMEQKMKQKMKQVA